MGVSFQSVVTDGTKTNKNYPIFLAPNKRNHYLRWMYYLTGGEIDQTLAGVGFCYIGLSKDLDNDWLEEIFM